MAKIRETSVEPCDGERHTTVTWTWQHEIKTLEYLLL